MGNSPLIDPNAPLEYWRDRCAMLQDRIDALDKEIFRLRGFKPLSDEHIKQHNFMVAAKVLGG